MKEEGKQSGELSNCLMNGSKWAAAALTAQWAGWRAGAEERGGGSEQIKTGVGSGDT